MKKKLLLSLFVLSISSSLNSSITNHPPIRKHRSSNPPGTSYLMSNTNVALTCPVTNAAFYDSGGSNGQYNDGESFTKTFTAPAGSCITFSFVSFSTESCCDDLLIYNGPNTGSPLIGTYNGLNSPGVITSSGNSITFSFSSDLSITDDGWEALISCVPACSGVPAAGSAFASPSSSCIAFTTSLSVSGGASGCGLTYQWQSANAAGGPYSNIAGGTTANLSQSVTGTKYFRRITTCGASSATSAVTSASVVTQSISCSLSTYNAATTTFSFENFTGSTLPTTDDVLFSSVISFGFPFCYAGQQFSGGYVASNSSFVFDAFPCFPNIYSMPGAVPASAGQGTGYSISSPAPTNADNTPRNAILGPWHDIDPSVGGTIRYGVFGTAPNRRFVVSYENVPMFSFSCNSQLFNGQIKLFETSNNIEIHIKDKPLCATWNSGRAIMGLHNHDGTIYRPPVNNTAHNSPTQWTMTNTAYRWTTTCTGANNCAVVLPIGFKSFYGQQISNINKLWWETSDEENVKEYIIERSLDAKNFSSINVTLPKGKASGYLYNDNTFSKGYVNYYRVTAVDKEGIRVSTSIYPIFNTEDQLLINSVYPNPANDKLSLDITGRSAKTDCSFTVYDQMGNIVLQKDQEIKFGANTIELNIESLRKGIYVIQIKTPGSEISRQKFSKL